MRRAIAVAAAVALLVLGTALPARATRFQACFVFPGPGCVKHVNVQIGWHVKLEATADWHAGKRVQLWQQDPGESGFHLAARLRFDDTGRVTYRWNAPTDLECCWHWAFKAIGGGGSVVGVSNRLTAETAPGD